VPENERRIDIAMADADLHSLNAIFTSQKASELSAQDAMANVEVIAESVFEFIPQQLRRRQSRS
jgi:hypothetical protein